MFHLKITTMRLTILLMIIGAAFIAFLSFNGGVGIQKVGNDIPPESFQEKMQENDVKVIDIRRDDELESLGYIEGAEQIDFDSDDFKEKIKALDKDETYLLYCASDNRSGQAVDMMNEMGFNDVLHLEGGFNEWKRQDLPVKEK